MMHADVFQRFTDMAFQAFSLGVPPAIIEDQSAECVMTAVLARCGDFLWHSGQSSLPRKSVLVLNTDSHSALVRIAKHLAREANIAADRIQTRLSTFGGSFSLHTDSLHFTIHSRCQMHMFFACLAKMVRGFDILNNMFCATVLLHKSANMKSLRDKVKQRIRNRVRFAYAGPCAEDLAHNQMLVRLLDNVDRFHDEECLGQTICGFFMQM